MTRKSAESQKHKTPASPMQPAAPAKASFPIVGIGAYAGESFTTGKAGGLPVDYQEN